MLGYEEDAQDTQDTQETPEQEAEQEVDRRTAYFNDEEGVKEAAKKQGWKDFDEYDGDIHQWRPAREFLSRGDMIHDIQSLRDDTKALRSEFDERLKEANKIHKFQIEQLREKQRAAVEDGDVAEYDRVQGQINKLTTEEAQSQPTQNQPNQNSGKPQAVQDWESNNAWIYDPYDRRAGYAQSVYQAEISKGRTPEQALQTVDRGISEQFPDINPRREQAGMTESPKRSTPKKNQELPRLEDLPRDAVRMFETSSIWKDEKTFIRAWLDSGKEL